MAMNPTLNLALWIVAGILAFGFLTTGISKMFVAKQRLGGFGAVSR
jgi:hypothetical protein